MRKHGTGRAGLVLHHATAPVCAPDFAALRARMVQRLARCGIASPAVLQAMGAVPRHAFVDSALAAQAYEETSLPIGFGQTISRPGTVAYMLQLLVQAPAARAGLVRVLEIGTGCGYQAAVLAQLARAVYSLERVRALHQRARANLRGLARHQNIALIWGDGTPGHAGAAPYTGIIAAAAGGEEVLPAWCAQLAPGARLVAPLAVGGGKQALVVLDKSACGLTRTVVQQAHFVPLKPGIE